MNREHFLNVFFILRWAKAERFVISRWANAECIVNGEYELTVNAERKTMIEELTVNGRWLNYERTQSFDSRAFLGLILAKSIKCPPKGFITNLQSFDFNIYSF